MKLPKNKGIKAVVMGGGTGTFMVLSSLKNYVNEITAVINMVDDGGSTGVLRDELGVLPPGDVRQSLVALSSSSSVMRELFNYRFSSGTFSGHAFGNIFLTALEKVTGSFADAVVAAGEVLDIEGKVLPVTVDDVRLHAERPDGTIIKGQKMMVRSDFTKEEKKRFFLEPKGALNPAARKAILEADLVIMSPGNFYSSILPILLPEGMSEALSKTKAKKIFVANLMNKKGQTGGFRVVDFVDEIERYVGEGAFDHVLFNNKNPSQALLQKYLREGEDLVTFSKEDFAGKKYVAHGADLFSRTVAEPKAADVIERALFRHDGDKLARFFMKIYFS